MTDSDVPPRGRWLHAHLRECAVQVWFQGVGPQDGDDAPQCTCDVTPPAALDDWGRYPYDHKSIAEIIYDFAVLRGDLSEEYARSQLVAAIERKIAHATRPTTPERRNP